MAISASRSLSGINEPEFVNKELKMHRLPEVMKGENLYSKI